MSCVITLVPIVVAMSATMTSSAIGVMTATACEGADELPVVETPFLSAELLLKEDGTVQLIRRAVSSSRKLESTFPTSSS